MEICDVLVQKIHEINSSIHVRKDTINRLWYHIVWDPVREDVYGRFDDSRSYSWSEMKLKAKADVKNITKWSDNGT